MRAAHAGRPLLHWFDKCGDTDETHSFCFPFAVQTVQKLNFQGGLSFESTVL